jgi:hypothetical protein
MSIKGVKPNYFTAVHALVGGGVSGPCVDGSISEYVFSDGQTPPTESAIQTELSRQLAEDATQEYARNRQEAYPSTGDQLDMIYKDNKNSTTTHADAVEAVKTKWPKDNSGPV